MKLEEAMQKKETMDALESIIESYSKLDRNSQIGKQTYFVESLSNLIDVSSAELIANLLSRGSSIGSFHIINNVQNLEVKAFLTKLISKYGAQLQWFLERFQKDWQRYDFTTTLYGIPPMAIINSKVIDKSGHLYELESPLPSFATLVLAQIEHLKVIEKQLEKLGYPRYVMKIVGKDQLLKSKKIIEELIAEEK